MATQNTWARKMKHNTHVQLTTPTGIKTPLSPVLLAKPPLHSILLQASQRNVYSLKTKLFKTTTKVFNAIHSSYFSPPHHLIFFICGMFYFTKGHIKSVPHFPASCQILTPPSSMPKQPSALLVLIRGCPPIEHDSVFPRIFLFALNTKSGCLS